MAGEIVVKASFEERMTDRIKDLLGEVMTDDELKKIVQRGIENAFFQPQMKKNQWGSEIVDEPLAIKAVRQFARERADAVVEQWLKENTDKVSDILDGVIRAGVAKICAEAFERKFNEPLFRFQQEVERLIAKR